MNVGRTGWSRAGRGPGRRSRRAAACTYAAANSCGVSLAVAVERRCPCRSTASEPLRRRAEVDAQHPVHDGRGSRCLPRRSSSSTAVAAARRSRAPWRSTLRRIVVHAARSPTSSASRASTDFGTRPCLRTSATNMFHCPPSSATLRSRCATVRSSTSRSRGLDDRLEEVVGPLELVPEHACGSGENSKSLRFIALHRADPQQVEPGEQPAAAALLLVRDLPVVEQVRHRVVGRGDDRAVERDVVDPTSA